MARYCEIRHAGNGETLVSRARWCDTFGARLQGFTFRRRLAPGEGLVLVKITAIHMLFVFTDLGVLWVDEAGVVVDARRARPWRLSYVPVAPARHVIEAEPAILDRIAPGDAVEFIWPDGA